MASNRFRGAKERADSMHVRGWCLAEGEDVYKMR